MIIRHEPFGNAIIRSTSSSGMIGLGPGMTYWLAPGHDYLITSTVADLDLEMQINTGADGRLFLHTFKLTSPKKEEGADTRSASTVLLSALKKVVSQLSAADGGS